MKKSEKFAALDEFIAGLGLSETDFMEYVRFCMSKQEKLLGVAMEPTMLPIVYVSDDKIEVHPYFIPDRKHEIWGVKIGNTMWKKTQEFMGDWQTAQQIANLSAVGKTKCSLPNSKEAMFMHGLINEFNSVMKLMRDHGIAADDIVSGVYWLQNSGKFAQNAFDTRNGASAYFVTTISRCIRLIAKSK
ncbi:MAG: hypothetical protein IKA03_03085 [Alphaproteobacteria bacterium]|nr:hypothetical protein [Alphaproteobacteria bacterium]